ncbi:UNVERIFIED_CONTAM: Rhodanese-like domain-containing protein 8, chloroplastic [Sesamum angustifolium]|uniref:Rhodanese-like domain-containing protein 8, chloroplastic n=1 Tax=Sesamum angustifolium TaxID=2727405 RepID=A0AAW2Q9P4_9LAMI
MMASSCALITWNPLSSLNSTPTSKKYTTASFQELSTLNNRTQIFSSLQYNHNFRSGSRFSWKYGESFNLLAFSSSNGNWVEVEAGAPKDYKDDEFIVVNFYRFVFIQDPEEEVSKHLSFMQGRDIHGRIYLNEQGINAQYSGPSKDALAYVEWLKEDHRFSDILVQISPAISGHAFPKLKLRYKPSLVQASYYSVVGRGRLTSPLLDPSMRATPLTPSEWRTKLEAVNKIDNSLNTLKTNCILLDVRNGYEWDVGHFQGAQRPDVDCFRSTSFGLSESEVIASDPLANVDLEKTDILMYCTGGIRCDVYSTILRQQGFKRLYTLKGGVSHYLESEGSVGWVGNLFVFDARLSLPPSAYKPEISAEASGKQEMSHAFAKCYICESQVSELRHRNCANLDCNLLFLQWNTEVIPVQLPHNPASERQGHFLLDIYRTTLLRWLERQGMNLGSFDLKPYSDGLKLMQLTVLILF